VKNKTKTMKTLTLLLSLITVFQSFSQPFDRQDAVFATYNVLSGGIISGVGAVINRQDNTKVAKAFVNGFKKGCVGGLFCYAGKKITGRIAVDKSYLWGWPANIVHSLGTSIIENVCLNKGMFSRYSIDVYCFNFATDNKYGAKININSLAGIGYFAIRGFEFKIGNTLKSGFVYFNFYNQNIYKKLGLNVCNSISIKGEDNLLYSYDYDGKEDYSKILENKTYNQYDITSHEIIHTFQYNQYNIINSFDHINLNNSIFKIYIPYFVIDYQIYNLINGKKSLFEKESDMNF
jgi:hypothetical protein